MTAIRLTGILQQGLSSGRNPGWCSIKNHSCPVIYESVPRNVWKGGTITLLPGRRASLSCYHATVSLRSIFIGFINNLICQGGTYHLELSAACEIFKEQLESKRNGDGRREGESKTYLYIIFEMVPCVLVFWKSSLVGLLQFDCLQFVGLLHLDDVGMATTSHFA